MKIEMIFRACNINLKHSFRDFYNAFKLQIGYNIEGNVGEKSCNYCYIIIRYFHSVVESLRKLNFHEVPHFFKNILIHFHLSSPVFHVTTNLETSLLFIVIIVFSSQFSLSLFVVSLYIKYY